MVQHPMQLTRIHVIFKVFAVLLCGQPVSPRIFVVEYNAFHSHRDNFNFFIKYNLGFILQSVVNNRRGTLMKLKLWSDLSS